MKLDSLFPILYKMGYYSRSTYLDKRQAHRKEEAGPAPSQPTGVNRGPIRDVLGWGRGLGLNFHPWLLDKHQKRQDFV